MILLFLCSFLKLNLLGLLLTGRCCNDSFKTLLFARQHASEHFAVSPIINVDFFVYNLSFFVSFLWSLQRQQAELHVKSRRESG